MSEEGNGDSPHTHSEYSDVRLFYVILLLAVNPSCCLGAGAFDRTLSIAENSIGWPLARFVPLRSEPASGSP